MIMTTESAWNDTQEKHEMAYFKGQLATEFPESYTVTSPMGNGTIPAVPAEAPKPKAFLEGYPDLLTPAHLSEITGMNAQYTRKLCRDGYLLAVQVGESRWYVPKKRFTDYVMGRVDIEADPGE